jgi:uncharacterized protein YlxW (UPF0749 family)
VIAVDTSPSNLNTLAILAPVIGVVLVALIGSFTARMQRSASSSAEKAKVSEKIAADYGEALKAKDELIESLKETVEFLKDKVADLEGRLDECDKAQEYASQIQHEQAEEIEKLKSRHRHTKD